MEEQEKLTMELVKSLMDKSYTLVWVDYNDNLDNCRTPSRSVWKKGAVKVCGRKWTNGTVTPNGKLSVKSSQS